MQPLCHRAQLLGDFLRIACFRAVDDESRASSTAGVVHAVQKVLEREYILRYGTVFTPRWDFIGGVMSCRNRPFQTYYRQSTPVSLCHSMY